MCHFKKPITSKQHQFELDVSFQSNAARLVLFGPSGAGKTQILKMLSGLTTPDNGHIRFATTSLFLTSPWAFAPTPQERALAYVFQEYALFPHLTVMQNIAFSLQQKLVQPRHTVQPP